jgi:hypothetical protein
VGPWSEQQADVIPDQQEAGWTSGYCAPTEPQHLVDVEPRDVDPKKMARVLGLYGRVLTADEIRAIAMIETEFDEPGKSWHVYPAIGWPITDIIYAKQQVTPMSVLVSDSIANIHREIVNYISDRNRREGHDL